MNDTNQAQQDFNSILSREEWDFSGLKDREIDACFHYEFSRSSPVLCEGLEALRKNMKNFEIFMKYFNKSIDQWEEDNDKEIQRAPPPYLTSERLYEFEKCQPDSLIRSRCNVEFIASFPEFPKIPWQKIKMHSRKINWTSDLQLPDTETLLRHPSIAVFDCLDMPFSDKKHVSIESFKENSFSNYVERLKKEELFLIKINWKQFRNEQIVKAFQAWIGKKRPKEFPEVKSVLQDRSGNKLPYEKRVALQYLGVYRLKKFCSWAQYLELSHNKGRAKASPEHLMRDYQRQVARAKEVIKWFERR